MHKIAVVTGATGGIGKEIVAELRQDHEVIEISRSGTIAWDLADIHAPIPAPIAQLKQVDVLVHAAATGARRSVAEATAADWQYQFNLNTIAPALLTKALLPALRQAHGKVIFINSGAGVGAHPGTAVYAATKHALHGIADALRKEEPDIFVSTISPGPTDTEMLQQIFAEAGWDYHPDHYIKPSQIAQAVRLVVNAGVDTQITQIDVRPRIELIDRKS